MNNFKLSTGSARQIIRAVFVPYLIVATILSVIVVFFQYNVENKELIETLNIIGDINEGPLVEVLVSNSENHARIILSSILKNKQIRGIILSGKSLHLQDGRTSSYYVGELDKSIEVTHPLVKGNEIVGELRLFSTTKYVYDKLIPLISNILFVAFIKTLILWILIYYFMKKIVLNPMDALIQNMNSITLDDLKQSNVYTPLSNEVTQLRYSFNKLMSNLQGGREALVDTILGDKKREDIFPKNNSYRQIRATPNSGGHTFYTFQGELKSSRELRDQINSLLGDLSTHAWPLYMKIKALGDEISIAKDVILKFSRVLEDAGVAYKLEDLHNFGSDIRTKLALKDFKKLKESIDAYPDFIKRISAQPPDISPRDKTVAELFPEEFNTELNNLRKFNLKSDKDDKEN